MEHRNAPTRDVETLGKRADEAHGTHDGTPTSTPPVRHMTGKIAREDTLAYRCVLAPNTDGSTGRYDDATIKHAVIPAKLHAWTERTTYKHAAPHSMTKLPVQPDLLA